MKIRSPTETAGSGAFSKTRMPTTGSLYFHIPFCTKKCPYCHFYVLPNKLQDHKILYDALLLHVEKERPVFQDKKLVSIYFGGGTPTLFPQAGQILSHLPKAEEITIEANPEEATPALFEKLLKEGFNRLSLGVQSLDDRSLQTLERTHSAQKAKEAIHAAANAGFKNISIDLMYDLPSQTLGSWQYTLDQLEELPIQHLSLYNLTIEPHTAFHKRKVKEGSEFSLQFLTRALEKLEEIGLIRYEISAFAKPGFESKHNTGYWTGRPFLGFGPSAFSYWDGARFKNISNLSKYSKALLNGESPVDFREKLEYPADVKERLAVQIRLKSGVDLNLFNLPEESLATIKRLEKENLLRREGSNVYLTDQGMLFYDTVAVELI